MRYIDVCSGISAPTAAWKPLGWQALCFAEIEKAPRAVLAHHYPDVPLNGDFTKIRGDEYGPVDLLVGGTPCQSFSVAGLGGGLADERGNLALEYLRLADRARPRWLVWENVPGVLSSSGGRDFGTFLGGLAQLGYGFAYAVLDAQHFGVPQRRRRVFVVGHLGDWRRAAAVLLERHSLQGNPPPRREKGPSVAALTANGVGTCGADDNQGQAGHLICGALSPGAHPGGFNGQDAYTGHLIASPVSPPLTHNPYGGHEAREGLLIAHSLRGEGFDASEDGTGRGTPIVPVMALQSVNTPREKKQNGLGVRCDDQMYSLTARDQHAVAFAQNAVAFAQNSRDELREMPYVGALAAEPGMKQTSYIRQASAVRRLTPVECERLQGFPDDFTLVPYRAGMMKDGPRYKMLGNSMAVPVVRWIGERIALVDALQSLEAAA